MIYSGYENGHYYVRITSDVKLLDVLGMQYSGFKFLGEYMLFLKRRQTISNS